jgi:hypothetical protein
MRCDKCTVSDQCSDRRHESKVATEDFLYNVNFPPTLEFFEQRVGDEEAAEEEKDVRVEVGGAEDEVDGKEEELDELELPKQWIEVLHEGLVRYQEENGDDCSDAVHARDVVF